MRLKIKSADWTRISRDPLHRDVRRAISEGIRSLLLGVVSEPDEFLREFVSKKCVLDIGVVEHDAGHMCAPNWKHAKVSGWSQSCLGIDVLPDEIDALKMRGFNVRVSDATSQQYLGTRFDRIVIGDVIEHVDDPVKLLQFAKRHLRLHGQILVTTPNPYWVLFWAESMMAGTYIANADHVRWVSPTMALELARRAELKLSAYWLYQPKGETGLLKKTVNRVRKVFLPNSEFFTHSFYFVFTRR